MILSSFTRDTRDGEAEDGTTAGKSSDEKLDGAISAFDFSTLRQLSTYQAQGVYHVPCCLRQRPCRLLNYQADHSRARAAARVERAAFQSFDDAAASY